MRLRHPNAEDPERGSQDLMGINFLFLYFISHYDFESKYRVMGKMHLWALECLFIGQRYVY